MGNPIGANKIQTGDAVLDDLLADLDAEENIAEDPDNEGFQLVCNKKN